MGPAEQEMFHLTGILNFLSLRSHFLSHHQNDTESSDCLPQFGNRKDTLDCGRGKEQLMIQVSHMVDGGSVTDLLLQLVTVFVDDVSADSRSRINCVQIYVLTQPSATKLTGQHVARLMDNELKQLNRAS